MIRVVLEKEKAGMCQLIVRDTNFLVVILNVTLLIEHLCFRSLFFSQRFRTPELERMTLCRERALLGKRRHPGWPGVSAGGWTWGLGWRLLQEQ